MKPIQLLIDINLKQNYWLGRQGPNVATFNDLLALESVPWLRIKRETVKEVDANGFRPWYRLWNRPGLLTDPETAAIPMIMGPNTIFANAFRPWVDQWMFSESRLERMLVLNDFVMADAERIKPPDSKTKVICVKHALRPEIYKMPMGDAKKEWDILILEKSNMPYSVEHFEGLKTTKLINGQFNMDELVHKAKSSRMCVMTCRSENFPLAAHEIAALGCPIIGHHGRTVYDNTFGNGKNAVFLYEESNKDELFTNKTEMQGAIETAMAMDSTNVRDYTLEDLSYENIREVYRKAFYD